MVRTWIPRAVLGACLLGGPSPMSAAPPAATVRLPVVRDTRVSTYAGEEEANLGGASRLRFKSYQEFSLLDVDTQPLHGRTIRQATLYLRSADALPLRRVTVGTISAEWVEGTNATGYTPQPGASSFRWRKHPDTPWADPGSDLCAVILGAGNSLWRSADAFPPDQEGWQRLAVEPHVVAARLAGLSGGFVIFDDTGSEWTRHGERYDLQLLPPRLAFSRDERTDRRPYLVVRTGAADDQPPPAVAELRASPPDAGAPDDEVQSITWLAPVDNGPAGTLGYHIFLNGHRLPLHRLVRQAAEPVDPQRQARRPIVRLDLRRSDWPPDGPLMLEVCAVDAAGNVGPSTALTLTPPAARRSLTLAASSPPTPARAPKSPRWGGQALRLLHPLDKINLRSGEPVGPSSADAPMTQLDLRAARNEWVGAQVLFPASYQGATPRLVFDDGGPKPQLHVSKLVGVRAGEQLIPDPAVPVADRLELLTPTEVADGARWGAVLIELFVPPDFPSGERSGKLVFDAGKESVEVPVTLTVWPFSLPNELCFVPEMNCYGLPDSTTPDGELAWYRLAHLHRTCLNRLPYHHNGGVTAGCAPAWNGREFGWAAWDRRFGPLFDGSAFAGSPRGTTPVEAFYLPLFENWPTPIEPHFNGDYWADRALNAEYRARFVAASRKIAEHVHERGWTGTLFQFYLNGKNEYKRNGWSRSTSPWTLDEPANFQDFFALRWFGEAFHEGINQARGPARLGFRVDISRPQWQRETLDELVDFNVVSGELRRYPRIVFERARRNGEWLMEYGGANAVDASNVQPAAWCVDAWLLRLNGVLPWQTIGNPGSWDQADPLALLYPAHAKWTLGANPAPSLRLKSFRYGQQLTEYLARFQHHQSASRDQVREAVLNAVPLAGKREGTGFVGGEDAGRVSFASLAPLQLEALRTRLGETLARAPQPAPPFVAFQPRRRSTPRPSVGVSSGDLPEWTPRPYDRHDATTTSAPRPSEPRRPAASAPAGRTDVVQGKPFVRDALLDPDLPEKRLGTEPRNNALRRGERGNAFLVRFDLEKFRGRSGELGRATLRLRMWDPSSMASTRLDVAPVLRSWDEDATSWRSATNEEKWPTGEFRVGQDTATAVARTVAPPDMGGDVADPPIVLEWDITNVVREWLAGKRPNHGLAVLPIVDRTVDDGNYTRLQVFASESREQKYSPALELGWNTK